jgi:hypothetical protein
MALHYSQVEEKVIRNFIRFDLIGKIDFKTWMKSVKKKKYQKITTILP